MHITKGIGSWGEHEYSLFILIKMINRCCLMVKQEQIRQRTSNSLNAGLQYYKSSYVTNFVQTCSLISIYNGMYTL